MSFLYPSMFWALTALSIPIIVHLFNFRRHKSVYFSNTATLKSIEQESARTKKLKQLVLLLLRCLFIIALVIAFAFPYKPDEAAAIDTDDGVVGVYIDNSMSMKALSSKTTLLEDARELARDLVNDLPPSTRYLLLTNSFEVQNEYPMSQQEMLDQIDRMNLDGPPVRLNETFDRFAMLRKQHGFDRGTLFVYSDFQENMLDLEGVRGDSTCRVVAVPMRAAVQANLSVDTAWLASPVAQTGMANELYVRVTNHGGHEVKGLPLHLTVDGQMVASATVDVEGKSTAETVMQIVPGRSGDLRCAVALTDYPVTFDDTYYFVIKVRSQFHVVELNGERRPSPVALVFADDPQYDYIFMAPDRFNLDVLAQAQLVVVNATSALSATMSKVLIEDAKEGASIVFFHDDGNDLDTNAVAVTDLALSHAFFNDIIIDLPQHAELPKVSRHVRLSPSANATVLMHLANGDPMLIERAVGDGRLFDFATTLDPQWSNLADNALFVPLMLKMAFLGGGLGRLSYTIGVDLPPDDLFEAGFYEVLDGDSVCDVMAWNDSRLESDARVADNGRIENAFKAAGIHTVAVIDTSDFTTADLVKAMAHQSSLWKVFVLIALLALLGEMAVIRWWPEVSKNKEV